MMGKFVEKSCLESTRRGAIGGMLSAGVCAAVGMPADGAEPRVRVRPWSRHPAVKLPLLGVGLAERFPQKQGKGIGTVDDVLGAQLIDYGMAHGVNYFDTGYTYHRGASELFLGQALKRYPRESYLLEDKMPTWQVHKPEDGPRIFEDQLKRCGVEYFDFYLMHNVKNKGTFDFVYKKCGVLDYLRKEKERGRIRHLGLSYHGRSDFLAEVLDENSDLEVCMMLLNAIEFRLNPDAAKLPEVAASRGVAVLGMEPLAGGRAANLRGKALDIVKRHHPDDTPAKWGFRFAAGIPGVVTLFSGMHKLEYMKENIRTLSEDFKPLSDEEQKVYAEAITAYTSNKTIPCTGCKYCAPCPYGVKIPELFGWYNDWAQSGRLPEDSGANDSQDLRRRFLASYYNTFPARDRADRCTGCRKCLAACTQWTFRIPTELEKIAGLIAHTEEVYVKKGGVIQ